MDLGARAGDIVSSVEDLVFAAASVIVFLGPQPPPMQTPPPSPLLAQEPAVQGHSPTDEPGDEAITSVADRAARRDHNYRSDDDAFPFVKLRAPLPVDRTATSGDGNSAGVLAPVMAGGEEGREVSMAARLHRERSGSLAAEPVCSLASPGGKLAFANTSPTILGEVRRQSLKYARLI